MKNVQILLVVICGLLSATLWGQSNCVAVPSSYSITDLGTLGGNASFASAVNTTGAVTGYSKIDTSSTTHVFLWTAAGGMQDLGTLGGTFGIGTAINSSGNIVGSAGLADNTDHAFLWTAAGGMEDLGTLIGPTGFSYAKGIDDQNRIVGNSSTQASSNGDAVIWMGTTIHDLGQDGSTFSEATAINSKFQVVGDAGNAFLWTKAGGFKNLGQLSGGDGAVANSINNHGMIAGYNTVGIGASSAAVVWMGNTTPLSIGNLGGGTSTALGVNDQCQVVGYSLLSDTINQHAFIWTKAGRMVDLNTLVPKGSGWTLVYATGINASGQIVGQGTIKSQSHAFLLTPIP
jgi:probable HAF family extracellular repeat protein